jgi:hypothetical protein
MSASTPEAALKPQVTSHEKPTFIKNNVVHYCVPISRYSKLLHWVSVIFFLLFKCKLLVVKALFVDIGLKVACISIMVS